MTLHDVGDLAGATGTAQDNSDDMVRMGRQAQGEHHPRVLHPELWPSGDRHPLRLHPELVKRGDDNPSRCHPERLARGDFNGSRLHPERLRRGSAHGRALLTEDQVRQMRTLREQGMLIRELAEMFGVSWSNARAIITRQTWRHIE